MKQIVVAKYKENIDWTINLPCIIYDKSEKEEYIKLPNFGREAHTYLHHIIHNYDNLTDTTIFTQGNPFPHCKDFLNKINLPIDGFCQLSDLTAFSYHDGSPDHPGLPLKSFYEKLFCVEAPPIFYFGAGAIFGVAKQNILKNPKSFYEKCLWLMFEHNETAWIFERFWGYIFKL